MKMLVQRSPLTEVTPFDLELVKSHIRVDGETEDNAVTIIAQTAAAEIEQFAQISLLHQTIKVTIFNPTLECGLNLPIGPVADGGVTAVTLDGEAFTDFAFVGGNRPYIHWGTGYFTLTPNLLEIEYQAGFGAQASDIPHDLSQALMDQAALHYDGRSPMDAKSLTTSPHMARIGARYRGVQA